MKKTWTDKELDILALNYPTTKLGELALLLPNKTKQSIKSKALLLKLRKKEKRFSFSPADVAKIKALFSHTLSQDLADMIGCSVYAIHNKAYRLGLKKDPTYLKETNRVLGKQLVLTGSKTRFSKGHTPANKGKKMEEFMSAEMIERTKSTRFRKGNIPSNHKPIGYERIDKNGYTLIKTEEPNVFRLKHRILWEQHYGPIPEGCNIQFKDGNPSNISVSNLYLISKSQQLKEENSMYARYPKEVQDLIKLKGALSRQINKVSNSD